MSLDDPAFPAATVGGSVAAKRRRTGTKVTYRLTEDATVRFTVQRPVRGRRVGPRCRAQTRRNRRRARRCTLYRTLRGSFTHKGKRGSNSFRLTGRLRRRALRPGRYRLVAVPTDAAGNRGKAVARKFRIIR